jgi:hypothetical protein
VQVALWPSLTAADRKPEYFGYMRTIYSDSDQGYNDAEYFYKELKCKTLATVQHMHKGTPYVYQGEELGMTNTYFSSIEQIPFHLPLLLDVIRRRFGIGKWEGMKELYDRMMEEARGPSRVRMRVMRRIIDRDNQVNPSELDSIDLTSIDDKGGCKRRRTSPPRFTSRLATLRPAPSSIASRRRRSIRPVSPVPSGRPPTRPLRASTGRTKPAMCSAIASSRSIRPVPAAPARMCWRCCGARNRSSA